MVVFFQLKAIDVQDGNSGGISAVGLLDEVVQKIQSYYQSVDKVLTCFLPHQSNANTPSIGESLMIDGKRIFKKQPGVSPEFAVRLLSTLISMATAVPPQKSTSAQFPRQ